MYTYLSLYIISLLCAAFLLALLLAPTRFTNGFTPLPTRLNYSLFLFLCSGFLLAFLFHLAYALPFFWLYIYIYIYAYT